jgi:hypothetical protein
VGALQFLPESLWARAVDPLTLQILRAVLLILVVACLLGVRPWRMVALPTVALLTVQQSLLRSVGYINHAEIAILFCAWVLAVFPSADSLALLSRVRQRTASPAEPYRLAILLMALGLLFGYTAIGAHRIAHASPEIFTGGTMYYHIANTRYYPVGLFLPVRAWVLSHPGLLGLVNAGFVAVTFVEILSPFCLLWRRFRHVWLAVILTFHLLTLLLMQIFFWENIVLILALMTDVFRGARTSLSGAR